MMRDGRLRCAWASAILVLGIVACSGASHTELLDGPTPGEPSDPSSNAGGGTTNGGVTDAGQPDAAPTDAGRADPGILCSADRNNTAEYCNRQTQACCVGNLVTASAWSCMDKAALLFCTGTKVACDSPNDCGQGEVCCGIFNDRSGAYASVECRARGQCADNPPADSTYVLFCDPRAKHDECASTGSTCQASNSLHGYFVCGN